jgi:hypothetical protein
VNDCYETITTLLTAISLTALSGISSAHEHGSVAAMADQIEADVIKWRHHFHQNPELSNREFETAKYIEKYLR